MTHRPFQTKKSLITLAPLALVLFGCAKPQVIIPPELEDDITIADLEQIRRDPAAFLNTCLTETRKLNSFSTHFQRQERLGPLAELKSMENIRAEYRDEPFSVRFTWMDENSEYLQCVFTKGRNNDKVALLPRHGLLGLPPAVQNFAPEMAVIFGKARNPITDFGPRRMMERTLDRIEKAKPKGAVHIRVMPPVKIGPANEPCVHLELRYPTGDPFPCKLQDLYIHAHTRLPVGTWLWLPGKDERSPGTLDGMYVYSSINSATVVNDSHFVIDAAPKTEAKTRKSAADGRPSKAKRAKSTSQPSHQQSEQNKPEQS